MEPIYQYGIDIGRKYVILSSIKIPPTSGATVVENELSKRKIEYQMAFRDRCYVIGASVNLKEFNKTISPFVDIFGKDYDENEVVMHFPDLLSNYNKIYKYDITIDSGFYILVDQAMLILLQYIKNLIIRFNPDEKAFNCVISIPNNYEEKSIKKIYQLCKLLDINSEVIIPNYYCNSICFVYENASLLKESDVKVCYKLLSDMGQKQNSLTLLYYENNTFKILKNRSVENINGDLVDQKLMNLIYSRMKEDFPNLDDDIRKNKKLYLKIKKAVITAKEKLSAVGASTVSVSVDNVVNDEDYEGILDIKEINEIVENDILPILDNEMKSLFEGIKTETNNDNPIDIVILGGSNRIPRIQEYYKSLKQQPYGYFNSILNQTVNMDENVSCGCCYYSLIIKKIWNVNIEWDISKYEEMCRMNVINFNINSIIKSDHFVNIEVDDDDDNYYQLLMMNHKWLIDRNKNTKEEDMKRNDFETDCNEKIRSINDNNDINMEYKELLISFIESKKTILENKDIVNNRIAVYHRICKLSTKDVSKIIEKEIRILKGEIQPDDDNNGDDEEEEEEEEEEEIQVKTKDDEKEKKTKKIDVEMYEDNNSSLSSNTPLVTPQKINEEINEEMLEMKTHIVPKTIETYNDSDIMSINEYLKEIEKKINVYSIYDDFENDRITLNNLQKNISKYDKGYVESKIKKVIDHIGEVDRMKKDKIIEWINYLKTTCNLIIKESPGNRIANSEMNYCKTVESNLDALDSDSIAYELNNKIKSLTSYYTLMKKNIKSLEMIKSNIRSDKIKNLCQVECSNEYQRIEEEYYNSQATANINELTRKINQYSSLIRSLDKQCAKYDKLISEFPEEQVKNELSLFFDDRFKLFSIANEYEQNKELLEQLEKNYTNYQVNINQRKNQLLFNFNEKKKKINNFSHHSKGEQLKDQLQNIIQIEKWFKEHHDCDNLNYLEGCEKYNLYCLFYDKIVIQDYLSAIEETIDELDEKIKTEEEFEMLEKSKSELLNEMFKDLNSNQLKQIKEESRLCYYQTTALSKYYQLREFSEEESRKYKDEINSDDINTLQTLIKKIQEDINNLNKTRKSCVEDEITTTGSSSKEEEEMLKQHIADKLDDIFKLTVDSPDLLDILKRISKDLENKELSTLELNEIYEKCDKIYNTLLEKIDNKRNERTLTQDNTTSTTTEGTTTTTTTTTSSNTTTGITKDYDDDSFPSFTFSLNNEEIKLPHIKSCKPRIVPDVKEIESGFSSHSYSTLADNTSKIELDDGNEFVLYSFRNEERELMQQKNDLYNICIKTIDISKYRDYYLHNYNVIRKLEKLIEAIPDVNNTKLILYKQQIQQLLKEYNELEFHLEDLFEEYDNEKKKEIKECKDHLIILNNAVNQYPAEEQYKVEAREDLKHYKEWIINECIKTDEDLGVFKFKRKDMEEILDRIKKNVEFYHTYKRNMMNKQRWIMDLHKSIHTDYSVEFSLHKSKELYNKQINTVDTKEYEDEIEEQIPIIINQHNYCVEKKNEDELFLENFSMLLQYLQIALAESLEFSIDEKKRIKNDLDYMLNDLKRRRHSINFYRDSKKRIKKDYNELYKRIKVRLSSYYKVILNLINESLKVQKKCSPSFDLYKLKYYTIEMKKKLINITDKDKYDVIEDEYENVKGLIELVKNKEDAFRYDKLQFEKNFLLQVVFPNECVSIEEFSEIKSCNDKKRITETYNKYSNSNTCLLYKRNIFKEYIEYVNEITDKYSSTSRLDKEIKLFLMFLKSYTKHDENFFSLNNMNLYFYSEQIKIMKTSLNIDK